MIVDIANMPYEGKHFSGEEPASIFGLDPESGVEIDRSVAYDLRAYTSPGELLVEGKLRASGSLLCSRCAEPFAFDVHVDDFRCIREVGPDTESVDLTDEIRESIILGFPNYPICSADCRGLCPGCGSNLNRDECGCGPPEDRRWGALDGLVAGSTASRHGEGPGK